MKLSLENSDGISTPSRRALLRTAVAGGAFAVPLIASFSMDSASAQTKAQTVVVSNMVCSNMTGFPTSVFFAELQLVGGTGGPVGPVIGYAGFEFTRGRDELGYQFLLNGQLSNFIITGGNAGFVLVETNEKVGKVAESALNCGSSGLHVLFEAFSSGQANLEVELVTGSNLTGMIGHLPGSGPYFGF
jgi:hypothetical protein